jgi:hypothetical protein
MNRRQLLTIPLSLGLLVSTTVLAGSKKKAPPSAPTQLPTIVAVTADSLSVKDAQATKTLAITPFTEINVNGRKGTAADLKPGMTANVTLGTDPTKASRIKATAR